MGIRSLSTASISTGVKRSKVWDQSAVVLTTAYESIATTTVGAGGTSTITFSSIPSTYKHLEIRSLGANSATNNQYVKLIFNSDTGANYAEHHLSGNGTTANGGSNTSLNNGGFYWGMGLPGTLLSNVFGGGITSILDYTNTNKYKTVRSFDGFEGNGSGGVEIVSNLWQSTSAITSITLTVNGGNNFRQYSQFALYGIKG